MLYRDEGAVPPGIQRGKLSVTPRHEDENDVTVTVVKGRGIFRSMLYPKSSFGSVGFATLGLTERPNSIGTKYISRGDTVRAGRGIPVAGEVWASHRVRADHNVMANNLRKVGTMV